MTTKAELWTLDSLRTAKVDPGQPVDVDRNKPVVFHIPAFQRSLVWPEAKQQKLIESILRGYPFGSLLLVERADKVPVKLQDGTTVSATNFGIIDGLQRTNAIVEHLRNSLLYASEDVLDAPEFEALRSELEVASGFVIEDDVLRDKVVYWMRQTRKPDIAEGFDAATLLDSLATSFEWPDWTAAQHKALRATTNKFLKQLSARVDLSQLQVPVLIYSGPDENLPEIFERINTSGTILSKYEIFAAAWLSTRVKVNRVEVRNAILRRYKILEDEGFTTQQDANAVEFSLFDYLHGLSQYLGETFPRLFSKSAAKKGALSSAFPLATLMFGKPLDKMTELDRVFPLKTDGTLDVDHFEASLLDSVQVVDGYLAGFLGFEFVSDSDSLAHGELQIVSMIAATAAHKYDYTKNFALRGRVNVRKRAATSLAKSIPQHYVYDILRQQWRGALYTYAYQRVWDNGSPSKAYLDQIDPKAFDSALSTLFGEQMSDLTHKRRNETAADRVFLKFLYSKKVSVGDQKAHKFDVEHLIPVKRIQNMTANGDPWALGALGNLGLLPAGANRIKRDETVQEYLSRKGKSAPTPQIAALVNSLLFVRLADVSIPQVKGKDAMTKAQYEAFVKKNWNAMCKQLKKSIGVA